MDVDLKHGPQKSANDLRNSIIRIIGTTTLTDPSGGPSSSHHHYPTKLSAFEPQALPPSDIDGAGRAHEHGTYSMYQTWLPVTCFGVRCWVKNLAKQNNTAKSTLQGSKSLLEYNWRWLTPIVEGDWAAKERQMDSWLGWGYGIPTYHIIYHDPHCYQCDVACPIVPAGLHILQICSTCERNWENIKKSRPPTKALNVVLQDARVLAAHVSVAMRPAGYWKSRKGFLLIGNPNPCDLISQTSKHASQNSSLSKMIMASILIPTLPKPTLKSTDSKRPWQWWAASL